MKDARWKWTEAQKSIAQRFQSSYGWGEERALQVAELASDALRQKYGGKNHYIPSKNGFFRDRVRREFNGRNIAELSKKYGISAQTVRNYMK